MYHIIPDIHGEAGMLEAVLFMLGWKRKPSGWVNDEGAEEIIFLGDFIDRGPENGRVINIVRSLMDSGRAQAVMGNHEFNALMFHHEGPDGYMRKHTEHNVTQHAAFLNEFPLGSREAAEMLNWMHSLPVCFENDHFRAIHAFWHSSSVGMFADGAGRHFLPEDLDLLEGDLFEAAEIILKGPEYTPGHGFSFVDGGGKTRTKMRLRWWHPDPQSWEDVAASVPEGTRFPTVPLPDGVMKLRYNEDKPVFYGHYWMTGAPVIENPKVMCLDYSVAAGGPLLAYRFEPGEVDLSLSKLISRDFQREAHLTSRL